MGPNIGPYFITAFQLSTLSLSPLRLRRIIFDHFRVELSQPNSPSRCPSDPAMWRRNLLSLSSKLASPNSNLSLLLFIRSSPKSHHHGLLSRSNSTGSESVSAADPVNWVEPGPQVPFIGPRATSASAFHLSSLAAASAFKATEAAGLAKHYGRCYWELSKARLRLGILFS